MKITKTKGKGMIWILLLLVGFSIISTEINVNSVQEIEIVNSLIYTPNLEIHPEIVIFEDTDFNETWGFPGTGTPADPFRIENYNITSGGPFGILIDASGGSSGFNVSFLIRNCWITAMDTCIRIVDAYPSLVTIDNCTCVYTSGGDGVGIYLIRCDGATVINCHCNYNFHTGIRLDMCAGLWIENNTCYENSDEGLFIDNASDNGLFLNNTCENNVWGITNQFSQSNTFRYNTCTNNSYTGYGLYYSDWLVVENNTLLKNDDFGFQILSCYNGLIMFNIIKDTTSYAVYLETNINNFVLHHNNFIGNNAGGTSQALDDDITGSPQVTFYDTATNEGNYWSDYSGSGNYLIDGTANNFDPYPLSSPVSFIPEYSYVIWGLLFLSSISILVICLKRR
jgi:parallel beta-helix repeat protein